MHSGLKKSEQFFQAGPRASDSIWSRSNYWSVKASSKQASLELTACLSNWLIGSLAVNRIEREARAKKGSADVRPRDGLGCQTPSLGPGSSLGDSAGRGQKAFLSGSA